VEKLRKKVDNMQKRQAATSKWTTAIARPPACSALEINIDNTDLRD